MTRKQKPPAITPGLRKAVELYLLAKAYTATIRPTVEAYKAKLVAESHLQFADTFAPDYTGEIPDMDHTWMMRDDQAPAFYAALDAARDAAGFADMKPGYCPLLVAEHQEMKCRWLICDEAEYITRVKRDTVTAQPKVFYQYVDLTVKFVLASCPDIDGRGVVQQYLAA